jgi:hypothetical protein
MNQLHGMFTVAQMLQPDQFDSRLVVLWDEYDTVYNSMLLNAEQSHSTHSHTVHLCELANTMKDMNSDKVRLFFVTGITRIAMTVRVGFSTRFEFSMNAPFVVCGLR